MITNPSKIQYEYRGKLYFAIQLVELAGWDLPRGKMGRLAASFRYHAKNKTVEQAFEIMKNADEPQSRSQVMAKTRSKRISTAHESHQTSYKYDMSDDFSKWNKDLELERSTEQRLQMGWNEEELIIKARLI